MPIKTGRPSAAVILGTLGEGYSGGRFVGVWTAGPKAFNVAVEDAAGACGRPVDVHQMAFDL